MMDVPGCGCRQNDCGVKDICNGINSIASGVGKGLCCGLNVLSSLCQPSQPACQPRPCCHQHRPCCHHKSNCCRPRPQPPTCTCRCECRCERVCERQHDCD